MLLPFVHTRAFGFGAIVLPLGLFVSQADGLAAQVTSGVATVRLTAFAAPEARLEPLASASTVGAPFRVRVNAPYRLEVRRLAASTAGSNPAHVIIRTRAGVEERVMPGGRVVWTEGAPGLVPLEDLSLPAAGLEGGDSDLVVYVVVAPVT
jgi:hypothetical protein